MNDMGVLSLRLPDDLEQRINEESQRSGQPRSQLIREALGLMLSRRRQERHDAALAAAARALATDLEARSETLALSEAFLRADHEALGLGDKGAVELDQAPEEQHERWWQ
jgi:metal-responsive CopG/Arc/MetJ family transcriptional regulator